MNLDAFSPHGNTVAITVGTSASAAVQVQGGASTPNDQTYLITCVGTQTAFVAMFPQSGSVAVAPVNGTPANGIPVPAGVAPLMIKGPPSAWFSTIATATGSTVYITPGEGGAH